MQRQLPTIKRIKSPELPPWSTRTYLWALGFLLVLLVIASVPSYVELTGAEKAAPPVAPFTVSVDPANKIIHSLPIEDLSFVPGSLVAAVSLGAHDVLSSVAVAVIESPAYQLLAPADAPRAVVIYPGSRKEQVASAFAGALSWSKEKQKVFLAATTTNPLEEGTVFPSTYIVSPNIGPSDIRAIIDQRFDERVLQRYATSTRELVPVKDALIIASLIERETGDPEEMKVVSGIIWNRLFKNMKLQLDASLQYVRGTSANTWWPVARARDKYITSPYNTYIHQGLPPGPIASPSVAAIIAALNPVLTDCLYYFHDAKGKFYCSPTYEEHVSELKKVYGRGR